MTLERAIEVFVHAFAWGKSQAHPYLVRGEDGLWVLQDGPGRKNPRKIEVIVSELEPAEVVRRIKKTGLGWHFLCHIHADDAEFDVIRAAYKELGYRAMSTEWIFIHHLENIPHFTSDPPVRKVETIEQAKSIPQRASQRRKFRAESRLYAAWDDATDYGWVESVPFGEDAWVSGLYVFRDARGRGFGRALMSKLLQEEKAHGVRTSVLVASSDGARLYPHLGYEKIAMLQVFCPTERA